MKKIVNEREKFRIKSEKDHHIAPNTKIHQTPKLPLIAVAILLLTASIANAAVSVQNITVKQRDPASGLVDIAYEIVSDKPDAEYSVSLTARSAVTEPGLGSAPGIHTVRTFTGSGAEGAKVKAGRHQVVWNMKADAPDLKTDTLAIAVVVSSGTEQYLVIDLSAGADASSYPWRYAATPPDAASDACRTTELWLRRIEAGTFTMGSPDDEEGRDPKLETQHPVTLTQPFYIGVFEMTQQQWQLVMGNNPSIFKKAADSAKYPVEAVSYNDIRGAEAGAGWPESDAVDATSFMGRLRARTGLVCDLPTEAQWEYACRAGTTTAIYSGKSLNLGDPRNDEVRAYVKLRKDYWSAATDELGRYCWWSGGKDAVTAGSTTAVGGYLPNAWGLYDLYGNAWEWCLDWRQNNLGTAAVTDPVGPSKGNGRMLRSGGWKNGAQFLRSAFRSNGWASPSINDYSYGFRVVIRPPVRAGQ